METIRIRRAGYPIRHTFDAFVDRYWLLVPGMQSSTNRMNYLDASSRICKHVLKGADYQLGKTKVFLKVSVSLHACCYLRDLIHYTMHSNDELQYLLLYIILLFIVQPQVATNSRHSLFLHIRILVLFYLLKGQTRWQYVW